MVIATKVFATPGKVAIYGWHKTDGKPIQPLYTGHTAAWVDYSHGIRLIQHRMVVNGESKTIDQVFTDPRLAPLLNGDGVMRKIRYPLEGGTHKVPTPTLRPAPGEAIDVLEIDPGIHMVIDPPAVDSAKPVPLVFYALPNGNTTEQTIGKAMRPGDDWHSDIQHIGAQTRFLRQAITDRSVVVAYLENELKSWPAWRRRYGDARIGQILRIALSERFKRTSQPRMVLAGHSGGGSLIFGYLNWVSDYPGRDRANRISGCELRLRNGKAQGETRSLAQSSDRHFWSSWLQRCRGALERQELCERVGGYLGP